MTDDDDDTRKLLHEWLVWWRDNDDAPPKMPDALHVRTAVHLITTAPDETHAEVARDILRGTEDERARYEHHRRGRQSSMDDRLQL